MSGQRATVQLDHRPLSDNPVPDTQVIIEEARRHQRRRRRRLGVVVTFLVIVLGALALIASSSLLRAPVPTATSQTGPTVSPLIHSTRPLILDLFWSVPTETNVSANLSTGTVRTFTNLGTVYGIARQGYILGFAINVVGTFSNDLRHTFATWTGRYGANPVPANDPRYVWVSSETGTATEVNRSELPVAPSVAIPDGTIVEGQAGPNLVLMGSPPAQPLELWSPTQQRVLASLGNQEFSAAVPAVSASRIVWSDRNLVHLDGPDGETGPVVVGPPGDTARFLAVSPDESKVAIVYQPEPGTPGAGRGGIVAVGDMASGLSTTVPGSTGALGLLAWSPDGRLVFFPRLDSTRTSVSLSAYRIGSRRVTPLPIPGLHLPANLSGAWSSIVVGRTAADT